MAAETTTFTPDELFAGEVSDDREIVTVVTGQNLAANTIVMTDSAGKVLAHDGICSTTITQSGTTPFAVTLSAAHKVAGVLIYAVDASAADVQGAIYKDGNFFADKLVWPSTINGAAVTNLLKRKLLEGSDISVTFSATGEL